MTIRSIESDAHVSETVEILERALVDAKAGLLSGVLVFGDLRGRNEYKTYKTASENYLQLVGKLVSSVVDLCVRQNGG